MKEIETDPNPKDIDAIKDEIAQVYQRQEDLKTQIPEVV